MPLVGIGLPVRNGERHLPATLDCLRAQDYPDFEVVVVDNASTDATEEIARSMAAEDSRFRYVRHDRNIGVDRNFNTAFALGRGELHMWAANDIYDPRYLGRCVRLLEQRPDAVAATTAMLLIDADGTALDDQLVEEIRADHPDRMIRFADFASHRHACQAMYAVMRRDAVARTTLLAPYWGSDRRFLAELALQGPVLRDPDTLFFNRWHPSMSTADLAHDRLRAPTIHYGRELARVLRRHQVAPGLRRRMLSRWCWENRRGLIRSALRGVRESARDLGWSRRERSPGEVAVGTTERDRAS